MFYGVNNYIWLNLNEFPPYGAEGHHLLKSLDHLDILTHFSKHTFSALLKVDSSRPPFFPISMAVSNIIWGNSRVVSIMTNLFFTGLLFFSIYYMGKKMQNRNTGLLAAFIVAMYPFVFGLSRMARDNFASIALVCLSLCCLIYTDGFRRILPTILLGLFLGLGILTRLAFILFIIGPIVTLVIIVLLDKNSFPIRKNIILNLSLASIIAIFLGSIWYFHSLPFLLKFYPGWSYLQKYPSSFAPKSLSFQYFIFYFQGLINGQISPFFAILFFIGLIVVLKRGKLNPLLFSWIIVAYAIFTLIINKEPKETSEYLPAFALITALGILKLKKQWLKRCLVYIIIFGGLAQYFIVSYTNPSSTGIKLSFFNELKMEGFTGPSYLYPISEVFFHYPRKGDWQISKIVSEIQKENSTFDNDVTIGVTDAFIQIKTDWFDNLKPKSWHENFVTANVDAVSYFLRTNRLFYNVISLTNWTKDWRRDPLLDFIISVNKLEIIAPLIARNYKLILQVNAPDASPVYVYKNVTPD